MKSTTARTVQAVVSIDVNTLRTGSTYDSLQLDRVLRDCADMLPEGAPVRIRVHDLTPNGTAFWRILPLSFQVEAANPWILAAWVDFLNGADQ